MSTHETSTAAAADGDTQAAPPSGPPVEAPAAPQPVGWTAARIGRSKQLAWMLVAAALFAVVSAFQPWTGLSPTGDAPACVMGDPASAFKGRQDDGSIVEVHASGCASAVQAVQFAKMTSAEQNRDLMAKQPPATPEMLGLPSTTTWLALSAALGAIGLLSRSTLVLLLTTQTMLQSHKAFDATVAAMTFELGQWVSPMRGIEMHRAAFVAIAALLVLSAVYLLRVNSEKRKADLEAFRNGDRDSPPALVYTRLIAANFIRGNMEKLAEASEAAKEDARKKS